MDADAIAQARAYLRIEGGHEDAMLATLLGTALAVAESFTGQIALRRAVIESMPADGAWHRLVAMPVAAVTGVEALAADGTATALPIEAYAVDLDGTGGGWVRIAPGAARRARVTAEAGLAADWAGLPDGYRQGAIRLAAHLFTHRDAGDEHGPPAVVAALWRPHRRMRLS